MDMQQNSIAPVVGQAWPGQGGVYAGIVPASGGAGAYHLIVGDAQGPVIWGPYDEISEAVDLYDGLANTQALLMQHDTHPAAKAASAYQADGHTDFYLPAVAELEAIWRGIGPQDIGWVWSSSQHSAFSAYIVKFDQGARGGYDKGLAFLALPVRRIPIG